jgi:hypothetical protein
MTTVSIMKDGVIVEVDESTVVVPPSPPSTNPADYPLAPWQFEAAVNALGKDAEIIAVIEQIPDVWERSKAMARYKKATSYNYGDPFLQSMREAIGMSEADLSAAWMIAKDLTSS